MRFRDDNRAVTVQVGAILLFATIVIALALYQATVVPSQNADVEYKHSQTVQGELTDVRNALLRTAGSGNTQPVSVTLGTQYPSRVFLMNPPPATGTLRTGSYENATVRVSNVEATNDETADFLDGSWTASTKFLSYEPDYNEYDNAAQLRYESSVLSNHYPDNEGTPTIPLSDQLLVDNETRTITLVTLNGSLSTSRSSSVSVTAEALSAPYTEVQVAAVDSTEPVNVSVPTEMSAAELRDHTSLGSLSNASVVDGGPNRVVVQLSGNDTYTLQTASVAVGDPVAEPPVHYLTRVDSGSGAITVEARDRFNNPVSGALVRADGFEEDSKRTGENGRAEFQLADGASGDVTLEILSGQPAHERVVAHVDDVRGGDRSPPGTTNITVSQSPVPRGNILELSAVVSDEKRGGTQLTGAYWNRTNPSGTDFGNTSMQASDGEFDQITENVQDIDIDTTDWELGNHTLRVWGVDAEGNEGFYRNITVEVVEATSQSTIRGVVFQNRDDDSLSVYDYRDGSVHATDRFTVRAVGGIGDWDRDQGVTDIGYIDETGDLVSVLDNATGTRTQTGTKTQGPISFFGDFDSDGERDDIAYKDFDTQLLNVATYNETTDSVEERTVRRASTGEELTEIERDSSHITGAQDIDGDGNTEFAYAKDGNLYFAEVVERDNANVYVIVEEARTTNVDIAQIGDFADLDDDGIEDDVPITTNDERSLIKYYDYSRDKQFQFANLDSDVDNLGGSVDLDGNGKQSLFFASDATLHHTEVGSRVIVDTGVPAELVGGAN